MGKLLIRNVYVLDPTEEFHKTDILVDEGIIAGIGSFRGEEVDFSIDGSGKLVVPGMISAHTHITTTLDRGLVDDLPLDPWMIYTVYGSIDLSPRDLYVISAIAAIELLESGTTALLDHAPINPADFDNQIDAVVAALVDVGIRAEIAPLSTDLDFSKTLPLHLLDDVRDADQLDVWQIPDADEWIDANRRFLQRWKGKHPRISCCLGPSGPQRCSRRFLEGVSGLAGEFGVGVHTHVYETKSQWIAAKQMFPGGMLNYLHEIGLLGPQTSLAHCVWVDSGDIDLIRQTGTTVVHNPVSNLKVGSGIAPIQEMRKAEVTIGLGADGPGSGDLLSMFEAMKYASTVHKLYGTPETWVSARDVFRMCFQGGAQVLRQPLGAIRAGCKADLTMLRMDRLFHMPKEHMIRQLVYGETGSSVDMVLVDGQIVVASGRVVTVDAGELYREAQEIVSRMYFDLPRRDEMFRRARPLLSRMLADVNAQETPQKRLVQIS